MGEEQGLATSLISVGMASPVNRLVGGGRGSSARDLSCLTSACLPQVLPGLSPSVSGQNLLCLWESVSRESEAVYLDQGGTPSNPQPHGREDEQSGGAQSLRKLKLTPPFLLIFREKNPLSLKSGRLKGKESRHPEIQPQARCLISQPLLPASAHWLLA